MTKPPQAIVDAFLEWYANDPHSQNEDAYKEEITQTKLSTLPSEQLIDFIINFAREGGKIQSGGHRTAPLLRKTLETNTEEFRRFILEPFSKEFDLTSWLERISDFNGFGQGLATIFLNRVDKKQYPIINNKASEAAKLLGVCLSGHLPQKYSQLKDAWKQLIEWHPSFDNFYRTDAFSHFLIGVPEGQQLAKKFFKGNDKKRYWIYAPGEQARFWDKFYKEGIMGIGWHTLESDLSDFDSVSTLREEYNATYGARATDQDFHQLEDFVLRMKPGDGIFVKRGTSELVGYGKIASDYFFDDSQQEYKHLREANWIKKGIWKIPPEGKALPVKTITQVKDPSRLNTLLSLVQEGQLNTLFSEKTFELWLIEEFCGKLKRVTGG